MRGAIEPSEAASTPSLLSCTLLPIHLLWLCLWFLAFSTKKKPALVVHTKQTRTHSKWHKDWKMSCHADLLLYGWKCYRSRVLTVKGQLKSPKSHAAEIFSVMIADRARRVSLLVLQTLEKNSPTPQWNDVSTQTSDIKHNLNTLLHNCMECDRVIITHLK